MFEGLSLVGTLGLVWIAIGAVLAVLSRSPRTLVLVAAASALGNLSAWGLKLAVDRPRPPVRYLEPGALVRVPEDPSFPSGHATMSFACALLLTWFRPRLGPFVFALAAAIAWSRVYVGVHYPLDVLGGAALGLALAGCLIGNSRAAGIGDQAAKALRWLEAVQRRSGRPRRRG